MKLTRRKFLGGGLAAAVATSTTLTGDLAMAAPAKTTTSASIDVSDASVASLQAAMQSGKTSSQALVRAYLARIKALDKGGRVSTP